MIDTIKVRIEKAKIRNFAGGFAKQSHLQKLATFPGKIGESVLWTSTQYDLKVAEKIHHIECSCSLPSLLYENNLKTLTYEEITESINLLSDLLGIKIWNGNVYRIDIGDNLILSYPVASYLRCFCLTPTFRQNYFIADETVRYGRNNFECILYNKVNQLLRTGKDIPEEFDGTNVLRYEVQFKKHLAQQFGKDKISVAHLRSRSFLKMLESKWRHEYDHFYKAGILQFPHPPSWKTMHEYYLIKGIESTTGISNCIALTDRLWRKKHLTFAKRRFFREILESTYAEISDVKLKPLLDEIYQIIQLPRFHDLES